jgi:hypothetical protein
MENLQSIVQGFFQIDSIWSVILRAGIWFAIGIVIIISTDGASSQNSTSNVKKNLGLFFLFLLLSGGLMYLLFGFIAQPISAAGVIGK